MRRIWLYGKGQWSGRLPSIGGDEYGRRTFVVPLLSGRALVIAYWTCHCQDCDEMREQTMRFEKEELT